MLIWTIIILVGIYMIFKNTNPVPPNWPPNIPPPHWHPPFGGRRPPYHGHPHGPGGGHHGGGGYHD